jgi:hypothetical protein
MKHLLLIILSILLLSSPVIGDNHKGETLYGWITSSGEVWKGFGDKDTNPVYKGDIENGVPNGQGTFTTTNGDKYVGEWKNGKRNGQGTYTYPSGSKYVGEYKDGLPNGQGTFTFGKGKWDGDKYVGEWKNGEKNGQGTYTWSSGNKYEGEWKDEDKWNGIQYESNGKIQFKYVNGKELKHNGGTLYRWGEVPDILWKEFGDKETQPVYKGDVKDGKPNGIGILTYSVGSKYVGEWKDGEIYNGTYNNKRGDILFKWVNGKRTY